MTEKHRPVQFPTYEHKGIDTLLASPRVLIADDDPNIRRLLESSLKSDGYTVLCASDGHELVQLAQQFLPHIVLVDLMMPQLDGYEAIRQMRNDTRIAHIPMLILTARRRSDEIVTGFETGADDYIAKPFDIGEVSARVRSHLRRAARRHVVNPLSGLLGGGMIAHELSTRLQANKPIALLHADLDNFKTFNDTYGFSRGDQAILLVARLLQEAIEAHGQTSDFLGHIGGDDFVVITEPRYAEAICRATLAAFDNEVRTFYAEDDWKRGYLSGIDRFGVLRRFNLLSLSIGAASTAVRRFTNIEEIARVAAEMKAVAKSQPGSSYTLDQRQRTRQLQSRIMQQRQVVIASSDNSLQDLLNAKLQQSGFEVCVTTTVEALHELAKTQISPVIIIADAQLGAPLKEFCSVTKQQVLILNYVGGETFPFFPHVTQLELPLPMSEVIAQVEQLAH